MFLDTKLTCLLNGGFHCSTMLKEAKLCRPKCYLNLTQPKSMSVLVPKFEPCCYTYTISQKDRRP